MSRQVSAIVLRVVTSAGLAIFVAVLASQSTGYGQTVRASSLAGAAGSVLATIPVGRDPSGLALNTKTHRLYVANLGDGSVSVVDTTTNTVLGSPIHLDVAPYAIATNPATNTIYAGSYSYNGAIAVINGSTSSETTRLSGFEYVSALAVNSATNRIFVGGDSPPFSVLDGATDGVVSTIPALWPPTSIVTDEKRNRVDLVSPDGRSLTIVDGASDTKRANVYAGGEPWAVATDSVTNRVYVTDMLTWSVSVFDGDTGALIAGPIPTGASGGHPMSIAVDESTDVVYVANQAANSVSIIDGATNLLFGTPLTVGSSPQAVVVDPLSNELYVANSGSNTVTVLQGFPQFQHVFLPSISFNSFVP